MDKIYDLIILGAGPAGMNAGLYAKQMRLDTLIIEKEQFGGQIATTSEVLNYLGIEQISGADLSKRMHQHIMQSGCEFVQEEVVKTQLSDDIKLVYTHNNCYKSYAVIIAIGTTVRQLGVENEKKYINKGLSYSAIKDADKFANKNVAVAGGGNSAIEDAIYLSAKASKVYLVHRRAEFRADAGVLQSLYDIINNCGKIELVLECKPQAIIGQDKVEGFALTNIVSSETINLAVDGIFVAIGRGADTDIIDELVARDENGYIKTNANRQTNLDGVYAVGDIRDTTLRQITTACADGAVASVSALGFIRKAKSAKNGTTC